MTIRSFLCATLAVALIVPAVPARAQYAAQSPNLQILTPLPDQFTCPPSNQWTPLTFCDEIKKHIELFNQYVAITNQLTQMKQQILSEYATYPQQVLSRVNQDVRNMESIVSKYNQLSYTSQTAAADAAKTMSDLYATTDPVTLQQKMQTMMQQSIQEVLEKLHLADQQTVTDQNLVTKIQGAAANATSPQQLLQMVVQLLAVMDSQLVRESQLHATQIKAEANYELVRTSGGGAGAGGMGSVPTAQQLSPAQLQAWLKTLNTQTPTVPPASAGSTPP